MPKELSSINDHILDIASARQEAISARFKPRGDAEPVKSVLQSVAATLATAFEPHGFRYSRSKLQFSRKSGSVLQSFRMRGDAENLSGVRTSCSIEVVVSSKDFHAWSQVNGLKSSDILWANQLGYIRQGHTHFAWDFLDAHRREQEAADMADRILGIAIPELDQWVDKASIANSIHLTSEVPRLDWLLEIALWAGGPALGQKILDRPPHTKYSSNAEHLERLCSAHGCTVRRANNSFKPKPLRGSA